MNRITACLLLTMITALSCAQSKVEWVSSTQTAQWKIKKDATITPATNKFDVEINLTGSLQTIEGFGTCFNEAGWTSLSFLPDSTREHIFRELFAPGAGANFTICRMPLGANDFSRDWYSYDEKDGDFDMKNFSIVNDKETLIPFIKKAQTYNPALKLWASPW